MTVTFFHRRSPYWRWIVLLLLSLMIGVPLEMLHLPAALLLGPMVAGIILGLAGRTVRVPAPLFMFAQGLVGMLIAEEVPPTVFGEIGRIWPIIAVGVVMVIVVSNSLGWLLAKRRVLPGTTAVWGSSPGAATAMVIMSEAYGGDMRLVAMMQYLRVMMVATSCSVVARLAIAGTLSTMPAVVWFPPIDPVPFAETLAIVVGGVLISRFLRLATGAMILPMVIGIVLQSFGLVVIVLPPWLLAACYAIVGWSIGLRFNRDILIYAAKALPSIFLSIVVLIVVCGVFGLILAPIAGVDPLTAYLATSPGGADSVAIIAASTNVDVPFVMAMQTMRFLLVLITGPATARLLASRV